MARIGIPVAVLLLGVGAGCGRVGYQAILVQQDGSAPLSEIDSGTSRADANFTIDAGSDGGSIDGLDAGGINDAGSGPDGTIADSGDPDAGSGSPVPPMPVTADVATFSTASASFVDVPGGTLQATADAQTSWVVLFSARLCTSVAAAPGPEARFVVDGAERGFAGIGVDVASRCGSFQQSVVLERNTGSHTVRVQLRQVAGGTASIDNLHLVALPLAANADVRTSENLNVQSVLSTSHTDYHALTFTPASPGDYLVLSSISAIEDTGSTVFVRVRRSGSVTTWPTPDYGIARPAWQSMFAAERFTLPATPHTFAIQARISGSTTGRVQAARIVAFRVDALAHFETTRTASVVATDTTNALVAERTSTPPPGLTGQVVIQSQVSGVVCGFGGVHTPSFVLNGNTETIPHALNCGYRASYGRVSYLPGATPVTARNFVSAEVGGNQARATDSVLHILGF